MGKHSQTQCDQKEAAPTAALPCGASIPLNTSYGSGGETVEGHIRGLFLDPITLASPVAKQFRSPSGCVDDTFFARSCMTLILEG